MRWCIVLAAAVRADRRRLGGGGALPAPTSVTAKPRASGVDLDWSTVAGASFYKVALSPPPPPGAAAVIGATTTSLRISSGLADGTQYSVTITPFDDDNVAGATSAATTFTTLAQPDPVGNPVFQASGSNAFLVTWDPPANTGGSPISSYTASCSAPGRFSVAITDKATTSALISGIPVTSTAACTVTVATVAGGSTKVNAVQGTVLQIPGAVRTPTATGNATGVTVAWKAPTPVGPATLPTHYHVVFTGCGGDKTVDVNSTSTSFTTPTARCTGAVSITPSTTDGAGPVTTLPAMTGDRKLTSPFKLAATPLPRGAVVTWAAPVDEGDGRSAATAYNLRIITRPSTPKQRVKTVSVKSTSYQLHTGAGVPVVVFVSAVNGAGTGGLSSALYTVGGVRLAATVVRGGLAIDATDAFAGRLPAAVKVRIAGTGGTRIVSLDANGHRTVHGLARGTYVVSVRDAHGRMKGLPKRRVVIS